MLGWHGPLLPMLWWAPPSLHGSVSLSGPDADAPWQVTALSLMIQSGGRWRVRARCGCGRRAWGRGEGPRSHGHVMGTWAIITSPGPACAMSPQRGTLSHIESFQYTHTQIKWYFLFVNAIERVKWADRSNSSPSSCK